MSSESFVLFLYTSQEHIAEGEALKSALRTGNTDVVELVIPDDYNSVLDHLEKCTTSVVIA